jgi:hypothetical protein
MGGEGGMAASAQLALRLSRLSVACGMGWHAEWAQPSASLSVCPADVSNEYEAFSGAARVWAKDVSQTSREVGECVL